MDDFPYEYVGGGYFRLRNVPKGQVAKTLHGAEAIEAAMQFADAELLAWAERAVDYIRAWRLGAANWRLPPGKGALLKEAQRLGLFKKGSSRSHGQSSRGSPR